MNRLPINPVEDAQAQTRRVLARYGDRFEARLRSLLAGGAGEAEIDRAVELGALHRMLDELPLTADDLRFILVLVTMAWGTPPGAAYRQLCSDAAAAGSSPACRVPPAGSPA